MKEKFAKINELLWEMPKENYSEMRVPARLYATEKIIEETEEKALGQLINIASLPGIVRHAVAMPDIHSGYGPPIGGVGATRADKGVISPGFVGFDENCGVRLLTSELKKSDIEDDIDACAQKIFETVPSGVGQGRKKMSMKDLEALLTDGSQWVVSQKMGKKEDVERCEGRGKLPADHQKLSDQAKKRGLDQVGTLGSGNHFIEIQEVEKVYDEEKAKVFGLKEGAVAVMIHTGSRGLGHQNCKDYLKKAEKATKRAGFDFPDRQFNSFYFDSREGQDFYFALGAACNFSFANRQMITHLIRSVWREFFSEELSLMYDVAHNTAKVETHEIDGEDVELVVHRKGATRAFPPGHRELPEIYKETGQPVIMPGSMGTSSYILSGIRAGSPSFYSTAHGAGRRMSRTKAKRKFSTQSLFELMNEKNILVKSKSKKGVVEEDPRAYKDIDEVVDVVAGARLAKKVAKVKPLAVIKGE